MTDRPILFSAPMVRAILREIEKPGTGKTETRRILKPQPPDGARYSGIHFTSVAPDAWFFNSPEGPMRIRERFTPGDRLYVREHWCTSKLYDDIPPRDLRHGSFIRYEADGAEDKRIGIGLNGLHTFGRTRVAMHMPRWVSRITLVVEDVKVERLQEISEEDARREGVECRDGTWAIWNADGTMRCGGADDAREAFRCLWINVNGTGSWEPNPWVAAIRFRPYLCNIDAMEAAE